MLLAFSFPTCSEIAIAGLVMVLWFAWAIGSAVKSAGEAAGKLLDSDVATEVGKGFLQGLWECWWDSK